ncbi:histidine phosphotransferase [Phenylobacterium montanum]|uniref:Histidine phosphotransferase n=2 Tax=Phenylobacterium montanum TaxID=2823693 RepID=A0A975FXF1_9CAUL|nr:histidine phosphotransferase [Caulobacter sp. S6]
MSNAMTDPIAPSADASPAPEPPALPAEVTANELASHLAARLCHDFISPAGAIVSGLDLLEDPSAQDMREEAMGMIAASANKLVALIKYDRIAFGGSAAAEVFDTRELLALSQGVFADMRAKLDWQVTQPGLDKPPARALLNLCQIGAGALPAGGMVRAEAVESDSEITIVIEASGRARLRQEVIDGLEGRRLSEGRTGHWVQAYYLRKLIDDAGGVLETQSEEALVTLRARFPKLLG